MKKKGLILFTKPVLELSDIELLTNTFHSKKVDESDSKTTYIYYFDRPKYPKFNITYKLEFINNKLSHMEYPIAFYKLLTSAFAIHALSSIGEASMPLPHKGAWEIQPTISIDPKMKPTKKEITQSLGPPSSIKETFQATYLSYTYIHPTIDANQTIGIVFEINNVNERVDCVTLQLPDRVWRLSF